MQGSHSLLTSLLSVSKLFGGGGQSVTNAVVEKLNLIGRFSYPDHRLDRQVGISRCLSTFPVAPLEHPYARLSPSAADGPRPGLGWNTQGNAEKHAPGRTKGSSIRMEVFDPVKRPGIRRTGGSSPSHDGVQPEASHVQVPPDRGPWRPDLCGGRSELSPVSVRNTGSNHKARHVSAWPVTLQRACKVACAHPVGADRDAAGFVQLFPSPAPDGALERKTGCPGPQMVPHVLPRPECSIGAAGPDSAGRPWAKGGRPRAGPVQRCPERVAMSPGAVCVAVVCGYGRPSGAVSGEPAAGDFATGARSYTERQEGTVGSRVCIVHMGKE